MIIPKGMRERIAERRKYVWEFRKSGATQREIRDLLLKLEPPIDVALSTVNKDILTTLAELRKQSVDSAETVRALNTSRLEQLLNSIWMKANGGDLGALREAVSIIGRVSDLWVPKQLVVGGDEKNPLRVRWDLSKLSDDELSQLAGIIAKTTPAKSAGDTG
jgi:hypothetical protein